ncbi:MAG TPA: class I SAM-dependent methyltransferase [Gaiellaceae bacterium]|nr:class I SAM-dependent methyltransferase [Gaiellaceae bacterium]
MSRDRMRESWDERARKDAFYYVETAQWDGDVEAFYALGEERARMLIDPVLGRLPRPAGACDALDLGCGVGRFSRALAARFKTVLGVDVSEEMVRQAGEQHPHEAFPNLRFDAGDGVSVPAADGSSDFIFSYEVFQHMPSEDVIQANLREVARVLRRDGAALLHVKTEAERGAAARLVPDALVRLAKRAVGRDPLVSDPSFRGTAVSRDRLEGLFNEAGLSVRELREDPTHEPGSRVFVLASPRSSR